MNDRERAFHFFFIEQGKTIFNSSILITSQQFPHTLPSSQIPNERCSFMCALHDDYATLVVIAYEMELWARGKRWEGALSPSPTSTQGRVAQSKTFKDSHRTQLRLFKRKRAEPFEDNQFEVDSFSQPFQSLLLRFELSPEWWQGGVKEIDRYYCKVCECLKKRMIYWMKNLGGTRRWIGRLLRVAYESYS